MKLSFQKARTSVWFTLLFVLSWPSNQLAADDSSSINFNRDIRPILSDNCFFCHGQDANKREADLRLDVRKSVIDSGAIVEGDVEASELINRIFTEDPDYQMPPAHSNRVLTDLQKDLLKRWVEQGARYETHWAFVAPKRKSPPTVADKWKSRVINPIDQFVLSKLGETDLNPSQPADRATLIKRLSIDLTGLPPSRSEVEAFINDDRIDAYERLVDRLMASAHYGERMALPWLDAARYADSNGFQQDGDTWQWIWRDWLVGALNNDMPFDQFTLWSIAGDLLPDAGNKQKIASGFNRNHMLNGEGGNIAEEQRFVNLFDRVDTTSTTWLGLTMACAQCHDHKYDPITQRDYYSLLDAFNRVPETGMPQRQSIRIRVAKPFIELPTAENKTRIADLERQIKALDPEIVLATDHAFAGWKAGVGNDKSFWNLPNLSKQAKSILDVAEKDRSKEQKTELRQAIRKYFNDKVQPKLVNQIPVLSKQKKLRQQLADYKADQIPRAMVMSDAKPRKTHILIRGEYLEKGEEVSFNTPAFLPKLPANAPKDRLGLARWLISSENPLTARVQVNRMWQYFFGMGLVKTSEDLGVQSEYPLHLDLLDWLALEFQRQRWSVKAMHRMIVTSSTYRQSSRFTTNHIRLDPENRLYARASRFRMPAMILRDWALASSGLLNRDIGGKPVYPYLPPNPWQSLNITKERDFTYPASDGRDLYRRSLYTFWRRTVAPANMFDASNRQACRVRTSTTSTPLHALTTLNDPTWVEAAKVLAKKSKQSHDQQNQQIRSAFVDVLCRPPTVFEMEMLRAGFQKQRENFQNNLESAGKLLNIGDNQLELDQDLAYDAALTSICLGILNLDEALTRE